MANDAQLAEQTPNIIAQRFAAIPITIAVEGIEWVRLSEIEYFWAGAFDHVEIHRADDVFKALMLINRDIEREGHIRKAVFKIRLEGEKKARTVNITAGQ